MPKRRSEYPPVPADAVLLSRYEAAVLLGVSHTSVCRLIESGQLTAIKAGPRLVKIRRSEVDRLIALWREETEALGFGAS
jgi:excisionase family DNA binding protein